jgi:hypothetical protein
MNYGDGEMKKVQRIFVLVIALAMISLTSFSYPAHAAETKESIKAMMGEPRQVKRGANGQETWIYIIRPGEEDFPIYRLLAGYRSVKGFIFTFDKDGTLKKRGGKGE